MTPGRRGRASGAILAAMTVHARLVARGILLAAVVAVVACRGPAAQQVQARSAFAQRIAELSEPGGFFDTDNLISNEASYLHAVSGLRALNVAGGAYLGVGPDQNFSYIAAVRPNIAFIIDLRRENMLLHLMFKALFEIADTRIEYLGLLFGAPVREDAAAWADAELEQLVAYVDSVGARQASIDAARALVDSAVASFRIPLSDGDWTTIDRFHRTFVRAGLSLRFHTTGRAPRFYYPTYRELLLERDRTGRRENFLASADAFRYVKDLHERDLIIPVVGDLTGDHALRAIGRLLAEQGEYVSAFYVSNVEFYLFRSGSFPRFVDNVRALPWDERSVVIRSVFRGPFGFSHPQSVPGYYSTQLLGSLSRLVQGFADGAYLTYWDLVTRDVLD